MLEVAPCDANGGVALDTVAREEVVACASQACVPVIEDVVVCRASSSSTSDVAKAMELVVAGCSTMRDELRWELPPAAAQGDGPDLALIAFRKLFFGIARLASIANRRGTNVLDRQQIDDALDVFSEDWPSVLVFVEELCQDGRTPPSQTSFLLSRLAELSSSFGPLRHSRSLSSTLLDATPCANNAGHPDNLHCKDDKERPSTCLMPVIGQCKDMAKVKSRARGAGGKPACKTPGSSPSVSPRIRETQRMLKGIRSEKKPQVPSSLHTVVRLPQDSKPRFKPAWKLPAGETDGTSTPRMSTLQELQSALALKGVHWPEKLPVASPRDSTVSVVSLKAALDNHTVTAERDTLDSPATNVPASAATAIPSSVQNSTPANASITAAQTLRLSVSAPINSLGRKECSATECSMRAQLESCSNSLQETSLQTEDCKQLQGRGLVGQRVCALEAKLQAVGGAKRSEEQQQQQQQRTLAESLSADACYAYGALHKKRTAPKRRGVSGATSKDTRNNTSQDA